MLTDKLKVGDSVYLAGFRRGGKSEVAEVVSVGTKYYTVRTNSTFGGFLSKCDFKGRHHSDFPTYEAWHSEDAYVTKTNIDAEYRRLKRDMDYAQCSALSVADVIEARRLLGIGDKT